MLAGLFVVSNNKYHEITNIHAIHQNYSSIQVRGNNPVDFLFHL